MDINFLINREMDIVDAYELRIYYSYPGQGDNHYFFHGIFLSERNARRELKRQRNFEEYSSEDIIKKVTPIQILRFKNNGMVKYFEIGREYDLKDI